MTWCRNMNSEWLSKHGYPAINAISDEEKLAFLAWAEKTHPAYPVSYTHLTLPTTEYV